MAFGMGLTAVTALIPSDAVAGRSGKSASTHASATASTHTTNSGATKGGAQHRQSLVLLSPKGGSHGRMSLTRFSHARYTRFVGGLQCVPYARTVSGIEIKGNAANWWENADGVYARGQIPEDGSVLNFRATGRMRLGHVAVVRRVLNEREVEIDHANWSGPGTGRSGISRGIAVIDVSPNNDWSEVRVGLGHTGEYGSVYPTYGFIYSRPDNGTFQSSIHQASVTTASVQQSKPARPAPMFQEVAEAPKFSSH